MLNSPTQIITPNGNIRLKPYQHILFNNTLRDDHYYENVERMKDRLEKSAPNMQQVAHIDMKRIQTNKRYERKLNHDLTGPRGLSWQCRQELQRLRSDERGIERELLRLNRDLAKITFVPSISRSSSYYHSKDLSQNHTPRLSSIVEENFSVSNIDKPKSVLSYSSSISPSRTSSNFLPSIQKRSSMNRISSFNEHCHWLNKPCLQQSIAKTSDDRAYLQQHAHLINQQKRLIEQKLKAFLH